MEAGARRMRMKAEHLAIFLSAQAGPGPVQPRPTNGILVAINVMN